MILLARMFFGIRVFRLASTRYNVLAPGTVMTIYRHTMTSEDLIILLRCAEEVFYDSTGEEIGLCLLVPESYTPAIRVLWARSIPVSP